MPSPSSSTRAILLPLLVLLSLARAGSPTSQPERIDAWLDAALQGPNPEARLALGGKVRLQDADLYDLELISGISDTLGNAILNKREKILQVASKLPPRSEALALEIVKGIGPSTRIKIARSLELRVDTSTLNNQSVLTLMSRPLSQPGLPRRRRGVSAQQLHNTFEEQSPRF